MAGFRSLQTDAAKCKQLHLQSLFSFRRLAPADDYLGSPCPFPLPCVRFHSFGLSTPVSRCLLFLPLPLTSLSFRSLPVPDTQLPVLPFSPPSVPPPSGFPNALAPSFVLARSSPFLSTGFPFEFPGSAYSALLFVPVRSSLLRSHSRSTGAPVSSAFYSFLSRLVRASVLSGSTQLSLSFPFAPVRLGLRYLVSVSSFPCFKLPPHSGFRSAVHALRFPSFPPARFLRFLLHASLTLSGSFFASFSSSAPLSAVPFRFLWSASLRIWYSVLLLFLSPPQIPASQWLRPALVFPLGFRPSP